MEAAAANRASLESSSAMAAAANALASPRISGSVPKKASLHVLSPTSPRLMGSGRSSGRREVTSKKQQHAGGVGGRGSSSSSSRQLQQDENGKAEGGVYKLENVNTRPSSFKKKKTIKSPPPS